jgi:hypothetical protein
MSTSVAYLRKRLNDIGRHDLLGAAERGEISTFAAAEEAGLINHRRPVLGTGSPNAAKRRAYALMRITGKSPLRPLDPEPRPEPEFSPKPAQPMFSQETRTIIERLVDLGRADLVIAVTERRISPFQAARIADRGGRRHMVSADRTVSAHVDKVEAVEKIDKVEQVEEAPKPKKPALDVKALIG